MMDQIEVDLHMIPMDILEIALVMLDRPKIIKRPSDDKFVT